MSELKYLVLQVDPAANVSDDSGRYGVLIPVNLDGFYSHESDAGEVAIFMSEQRPDLDTFVVSVVKAVRVHK